MAPWLRVMPELLRGPEFPANTWWLTPCGDLVHSWYCT